MPIAVGLLDSKGHDLPLVLESEGPLLSDQQIIPFHSKQETFVFQDVPVPSSLRPDR